MYHFAKMCESPSEQVYNLNILSQTVYQSHTITEEVGHVCVPPYIDNVCHTIGNAIYIVTSWAILFLWPLQVEDFTVHVINKLVFVVYSWVSYHLQ